MTKTYTLLDQYRQSLATIRDWYYRPNMITTPAKYRSHRAFCLDTIAWLRENPEIANQKGIRS